MPVAFGEQACGDFGLGRMIEPHESISIISEEQNEANYQRDVDGKKIVITVGSTRELIDPVRYI